MARASAFQAEGCGFESRFPLQSRAHIAQLAERILGKDEVHRFDPGRGLHAARAQRVKEFGEPQAAACVYILDLGSGRLAGCGAKG